MVEQFFITINQWMAGSPATSAAGCFIWGMVSVMLSPCHMASIPLIVAYVGGQSKILKPKQAGIYSIAFTTGLFITIALIGVICAFLGRMLGDVGSYWQVIIGMILIYVALGMAGVEACSMSGRLLCRLNVRGFFGAFVLGLLYGVVSGSCTFGFIAPILAIITVQQKVIIGMALIVSFAAGHCLPIVIAGSSTAAVQRLVENTAWQGAGNMFRKGSAVFIGMLGIYFMANPFIL